VKSIETLVEQGQLEEYMAQGFALEFDQNSQKRLIKGKDAAGIAATVREWSVEQAVIGKVTFLARDTASIFYVSYGGKWHIDKASPEGRKIIAEQLRQARAALDNQIAAVEALASGASPDPMPAQF
jgi:hypothetical protein